MSCPYYNNGQITCSLGVRDDKCWSCVAIQKNRELGEFWKNKDMLYNFHSTALGIPIESKTQWKRELKSRGLTDDFSQSRRELDINNHKEPKRFNKEEIKNHIRTEMKERGIYDRNKLFLKTPKQYRIAD